MKKLLLSSVMAFFLAACASEPVQEEVAPAPAAAEPAAAPAPAAVEAPAPAPEPVAAMPENNSVYFAFDMDAVQSGDRDTIQAHGAYLAKNGAAKVRIEGNCDERGSPEYNLGLGQRRANNVRKALVLAGAQESQIETVSFGEEKPRASGHDEDSWAQNRRADIVYK